MSSAQINRLRYKNTLVVTAVQETAEPATLLALSQLFQLPRIQPDAAAFLAGINRDFLKLSFFQRAAASRTDHR